MYHHSWMLRIALLASLYTGGVCLGQTIIVDNADAGFSVLTGIWNTGAYGSPYGTNYRWAYSGGEPAEAEWRPDLPEAGEYEVAIHYVSGSNRATDAPFTIHYVGGTTTVLVNQQVNNSTWVRLGRFTFDAGTTGRVTLSDNASPLVVIGDAVRFRSTAGMFWSDDPNIRIGGTLFPQVVDHAMRLDRIDPLLFPDAGDLFSPSVAVLTTGVTVRFRTDSASVRANFNHISHVITEGTDFAVYQNGVFDQLVDDLETVEITPLQPGTPTTYEIVCPSYDEVTFAELELEPGTSLLPLSADRRPRYFAIGDSITHGAELDADTKADSTKSYPWVLASTRGWELFNIAVGGSKVTPAFGNMLAGERADLITILWGLNDKSRDNDLALYITKYEALLDNLRAAQPWTPIYCITPIVCGNEGPGSNGYTLDDYRDAVADIVVARQTSGDCQLHLVRGEELTALADLSDGAHLSVPGAANFAAGLDDVLGHPWGDFDGNGTWTVSDWHLLADCLAGPDVISPGEPCINRDHDCDGDVDLREFAAFQYRCDP